MRLKGFATAVCAISLIGAGCESASTAPEAINPAIRKNMRITSPAFGHNQPIPAKYTCDGADLIPPLDFAEVPTGTKSLALIMDDPDAPRGTWDHWLVFDLTPETKGIAEGTEPKGTHGLNSSGDLKYGGPCPPNGQHRYVFKLYALDSVLGLEEGSSKRKIETAMQSHILDQAELVGVYAR